MIHCVLLMITLIANKSLQKENVANRKKNAFMVCLTFLERRCIILNFCTSFHFAALLLNF